MGGLRTAGDLVARMQMTRGMKLAEAKKYVAVQMGISTTELIDEVVMREVREDHKIGFITSSSIRSVWPVNSCSVLTEN